MRILECHSLWESQFCLELRLAPRSNKTRDIQIPEIKVLMLIKYPILEQRGVKKHLQTFNGLHPIYTSHWASTARIRKFELLFPQVPTKLRALAVSESQRNGSRNKTKWNHFAIFPRVISKSSSSFSRRWLLIKVVRAKRDRCRFKNSLNPFTARVVNS